MKVKAHRKPLNLKRVTQLTQQLMNDLWINTGFIRPSIRPEEEAEVKFRAHQFVGSFAPSAQLVKELGQNAADEKMSRLRHFTVDLLIKQILQGTLNFYDSLEKQRVKKPSAFESTEAAIARFEEQELAEKILAAVPPQEKPHEKLS